MQVVEVLVGGKWQPADTESVFHAENPATGEALSRTFPVSRWSDCDRALQAAVQTAIELESVAPETIADFLDTYAARIDAAADTLAQAANEETGLAVTPRLRDVELPRTSDQLRQAANAARNQSWRRVVIDEKRNIRSCFAPIGPVVVFGPNNFPFAFNAVSGGDLAAAIAAANPVIAKAHPLHPHTSELLAREAHQAVLAAGLPGSTVQMLYQVASDTGLKLVSDPRVGAVSFTGSRAAGLALKRAADEAGRPIYLELSSLNPVFFLPRGMQENAPQWATELADSCTAGAGQFCTRPNVVFLYGGPSSDEFLSALAGAFQKRAPAPLLSSAGRERLHEALTALQSAGAERVTGGESVPGAGYRYASTLLRVSAKTFFAAPEKFQHEAFGNSVLAVIVDNAAQMLHAAEGLEGTLTATVYSANSGADDALYNRLAPVLRRKAGRLLNDKMPTGVAVSPAMNHGGPYPSTGHPGFTGVGIPASIRRFNALHCYDNVREQRLPGLLRNHTAQS